MIQFLGDYVAYAWMILPAAAILWELTFLWLLGSRRHIRRLGVAFYLAAFSMPAGIAFRLPFTEPSDVQVTMFLLMLLGAGLPLVSLLVREDAVGELSMQQGLRWSRVVGVWAYLFSMVFAYSLTSIQ